MIFKDTMATDMIFRAYDIIIDLVKRSPLLNESGIENFENSVRMAFTQFLEESNIIYVPSDDRFYKVLSCDFNNRSITIDEGRCYNNDQIETDIINWGRYLFSEKFTEILESLSRGSADREERLFCHYLIYKTYIGMFLHKITVDIIFEFRQFLLPYISMEDPDSYVFLSLNVNMWWDIILNGDVEKDVFGDNPIMYIKSTISVGVDELIRLKDVHLVDMRPILKAGNE